MQRILFIFLNALILCLNSAMASKAIVIDGSTGVKPLIEALSAEYQKHAPSIEIKIGSGLKPKHRLPALSKGDIDIAMASHGIDAAQIEKLGLQLHSIAKVAVVIGINQEVGIANISQQQLCDIYAGKINNWKALGGADMVITPLLRPFNEVDTEVIVAHVPCFSALNFSNKVITKKKSGQMARALAATQGAIGMTTLVRVAQSRGQIETLALDGVEPNEKNLSSKSYKLTRALYLITSAKQNDEISAFLQFIHSAQGSKIIRTNFAMPAF